MKKIFSILLFIMIFIISACNKTFLKVNNNNPNSPTSISYTFLMSNDLYQMANEYSIGLPQFLGFWMGYFSRSGNYIPDNATETYEISPGYAFSETYWQQLYHTNLDLNQVDQEATNAKDPYFSGVAKILKSYNFAQLVDVYNNIPYSQALDINVLRPGYDNADSIYLDLFSKIDSGIALLKTADTTTNSAVIATMGSDVSYDIMFQGNFISWIQFGNTVKLKILLNLSQMASQQSFIKTQLANIAAEGDGFLMAGNGAMINPEYSNSLGKQNPFYGFFGATPTGSPTTNNGYYRANGYATNFYTNTNDPRLSRFYAITSSAFTAVDTVSGNFQGDPNSFSNSNTSGFGPGLLGTATSSTPLLPDFESLFFQAEAAQRGWITGSAEDFYQQAITQSFIYEGVPNAAAAATTYYNQPGKVNVNWSASSANRIQAIIVQEWAALNGVDILETWDNYRRLTLPKDIPISLNPHLTTKQIPVRLLYPQTEVDRNPDNVNAVNAGLKNGAQFTDKIFWMP